MPTLHESQEFFFNLMAHPQLIQDLKKNRARTLKRFFSSEKDRKILMKPALERFQTYRDHISTGLLGQIGFAFPVIRSLVSSSEWNELLNDFYLKRLTISPIARHVFREFSLYLQKYRGPLLKRMPYLHELAEYENLDLQLLYDRDQPIPEDLNADLADKDEVPFLNPHHALRTYRWPVHRIARGFSAPQKVRPGKTVLLVYRDPQSLKIRFLEANVLVADLVGQIDSKKRTVQQIMKNLLKKHKTDHPEIFVREGIIAMEFLKEKGVVLGYRKPKGEKR